MICEKENWMERDGRRNETSFNSILVYVTSITDASDIERIKIHLFYDPIKTIDVIKTFWNATRSVPFPKR
jgi:hypothetical protein